ncbi:HK97-gp10 family putative phage morphogenesis protein [Paraclostridium tenue]|uniref:HK97 gp10 family phage protein n=1 Tax=Paraclostridium tenue TaxID=1737 RepID=A0ABP3XF81_9FIRM
MGLEFDMKKVMKRFEDMEKKSKSELAKNGLNKGADILVEGSRITCPKDTHKLEESINKTDYKSGKNPSIKVTIVGDEDVKRYGYYQEHGTESMVGKKWMKKAGLQYKSEALEKMAESIFIDLGLK